MFTVTKIETDDPELYWVYLQADPDMDDGPARINLRIPMKRTSADINAVVEQANDRALSLLRSIVDAVSGSDVREHPR